MSCRVGVMLMGVKVNIFKYLSHREGSLFTYLSLLCFHEPTENQKLRYFIPHLQTSQIARFAQMMTNAAAPVQKVLMVVENESSPDECAGKSWIFVKKSDFFMFFLSRWKRLCSNHEQNGALSPGGWYWTTCSSMGTLVEWKIYFFGDLPWNASRFICIGIYFDPYSLPLRKINNDSLATIPSKFRGMYIQKRKRPAVGA